MWAAGVLGVVLVVGGFVVRRLDADTLGGAVAQAAWGVMVRPLWWGVALLAAFGLAMMLACDSVAPAALAAQRCRACAARRSATASTPSASWCAPSSPRSSASPPSPTRWV